MSDEGLSREEVTALLDGATEGPWIPSKSYRAVVSASPSGYDDDLSVNAYGGHLICESVLGHNMPLIQASPTLARQLLRCMDENADRARRIVEAETLATERLHSFVAAEAVNARLTNERDTWREGSKAQAAGCEQLRAEVARLRTENTLLLSQRDALIEAEKNAHPTMCAMRRAQTRAEADRDAMAAEVARLREAMEQMREGWENVLELDLIPDRHRGAARVLADTARAALAGDQP